MSAEDNLSKQLFHGTGATLKKGTIIKPVNDEVAWATSEPNIAEGYARTANDRAFGRVGRLKETNEPPALFNPVYTVEPVDPTDVTTTGTRNQIHTSKKGFRVTGLHGFVSGDLA